jgi:pimeloyl-ACP methyl ester carboxylesterase
MGQRVVLVHGAWHGGWAFERVLPLLRGSGVTALAVDLPGHGEDAASLGDLHTDAARVRAELDRADDRVVLLGHSYGGAVITEAGDHPAVSHLVYLCAMALDANESCGNAVAEEAAGAGVSHEGRPDVGAGLRQGPDGTTTLDPTVAATCFYNDCDAATVAWATARLEPQSMVALTQVPSAVAWRTKPSTYVVCSGDLAIHPEVQRLLARRCTTTVEWPTGHSPFLSRPELVTSLLAELAVRSA